MTIKVQKTFSTPDGNISAMEYDRPPVGPYTHAEWVAVLQAEYELLTQGDPRRKELGQHFRGLAYQLAQGLDAANRNIAQLNSSVAQWNDAVKKLASFYQIPIKYQPSANAPAPSNPPD